MPKQSRRSTTLPAAAAVDCSGTIELRLCIAEDGSVRIERDQ
jgi:hypothetical protein